MPELRHWRLFDLQEGDGRGFELTFVLDGLPPGAVVVVAWAVPAVVVPGGGYIVGDVEIEAPWHMEAILGQEPKGIAVATYRAWARVSNLGVAPQFVVRWQPLRPFAVEAIATAGVTELGNPISVCGHVVYRAPTAAEADIADALERAADPLFAPASDFRDMWAKMDEHLLKWADANLGLEGGSV